MLRRNFQYLQRDAEGNFMLPAIRPSDQLICIPRDAWRDGNIVVIDINDADTIKRIYRAKDGGIDLIPDNKQFKSMPLYSGRFGRNASPCAG